MGDASASATTSERRTSAISPVEPMPTSTRTGTVYALAGLPGMSKECAYPTVAPNVGLTKHPTPTEAVSASLATTGATRILVCLYAQEPISIGLVQGAGAITASFKYRMGSASLKQSPASNSR